KPAMLLALAAIDGASQHKGCKAHASKQGLARDSRWQDGGEHAGPEKNTAAILFGSHCDIVNIYFPFLTAKLAVAGAAVRKYPPLPSRSVDQPFTTRAALFWGLTPSQG